MKPQIGDIRVRYYTTTAKTATILAQQWNTLNGMTTFRTFNFQKVDAKKWESTIPSPDQYKRNLGCGKFFKSIIGGLAISFVDKAESGTDFNMYSLLERKLKKQRGKVRRLRFIWYFWMTVAFYGVFVPFTAELAVIPMIGGLLISLES